MKKINKYLKVIAFFLSTLMLIQGCTVYRTTPVTLEEASKSNTKARVKTVDKKNLKFDKIVISPDNEIYGHSEINKSTIITPIDKDNIEKIQVKDELVSTILTIAIPVTIGIGILVFLVAQSLNDLDWNFSNVSN
ncbi:hypothetical protein [Aestuariivivens sediminicola]|uniref:hypothetical protein n=1 Tax=Aestuariivivens sediminicola TaxID=2913560 RepID=UPI001F5AFD64|nr:hypothetical protein [Aestuariivivens sediminicola]